MAHRATPPKSPGFLSCQHGRFLAHRHVAKFESGFKPTRLFCLERLGESCLQDISRKFDVATASHCRGLRQLDRGVYQEELRQRPTSCRGRHRQQRRSH
ncbi:Uncharacterized protein FKW44_014610 [Caligus rogercresseyi]|uniref:Uncharacterized protein n=1 Tax=Caligus rogercresseyi TaxID=217165 RepID=A0A7T8GZ88_CALRO|nr:Uncharacterized protein FKW44_014610 [Caligus rogercresseyi]